jgi:hypothetical protein
LTQENQTEGGALAMLLFGDAALDCAVVVACV